MCLPEVLPPAEIAQIISEMRSCTNPQKMQKPMYTAGSRKRRQVREACLEDASIDDDNYQLRGVFLLGV